MSYPWTSTVRVSCAVLVPPTPFLSRHWFWRSTCRATTSAFIYRQGRMPLPSSHRLLLYLYLYPRNVRWHALPVTINTWNPLAPSPSHYHLRWYQFPPSVFFLSRLIAGAPGCLVERKVFHARSFHLATTKAIFWVRIHPSRIFFLGQNICR